MRFKIAYLTVATSFAAIDMVWLGIMAERLYRPALGEVCVRSQIFCRPFSFIYSIRSACWGLPFTSRACFAPSHQA
jgi:uncharacterized membrane protein